MAKPEPEIYRRAAERIGLAPEACVFVDDAEVNVRAAEALGMRGVVYRVDRGHDLTALLASSQAARGGSNLAGYQSARMDGMLTAARTAVDPTARKARFDELQKELRERMPFLPLFLEDRVELVADRLEGPTPRQLSSASDRFWDVLTWRLAGGP